MYSLSDAKKAVSDSTGVGDNMQQEPGTTSVSVWDTS